MRGRNGQRDSRVESEPNEREKEKWTKSFEERMGRRNSSSQSMIEESTTQTKWTFENVIVHVNC